MSQPKKNKILAVETSYKSGGNKVRRTVLCQIKRVFPYEHCEIYKKNGDEFMFFREVAD